MKRPKNQSHEAVVVAEAGSVVKARNPAIGEAVVGLVVVEKEVETVGDVAVRAKAEEGKLSAMVLPSSPKYPLAARKKLTGPRQLVVLE